MTEYTTLAIQKNTKPHFEQAKKAVKAELGDTVTQSDVIRELSEAYVGNQPLGAWKNE